MVKGIVGWRSSKASGRGLDIHSHRPARSRSARHSRLHFARIGAVVNPKVEDYYPSGKRLICRFMAQFG